MTAQAIPAGRTSSLVESYRPRNPGSAELARPDIDDRRIAFTTALDRLAAEGPI